MQIKHVRQTQTPLRWLRGVLCWVTLMNIISWKQDTETALLFSSSSPNDVHLFDARYLQVLYETWGPRDWGRCLLFKKPFDCKMLWLVIPYTLHTTQPVSKVKSVPCSALLQRNIKRACLTTIANPILYIQLWSSIPTYYLLRSLRGLVDNRYDNEHLTYYK